MNLNILIINQDDDLYMNLSRFLMAEGHRTTCLPCETDSVAKIVQLCPDLIIIEIALSELPAIEIITRLHAQRSPAGKHIPVIVISDFPSLEFELHHISDFICKPVDFGRVREIIDTLAVGGGKKEAHSKNASLSPEENKIFQDYLVTHSGLYFGRHNIKMLERGLDKRMATLRINSYNDYYEYLSKNMERRQELQKLLQFLTVGESFFFRQQGHFASLIETVLPDIIKIKGGKRIRLWSAGCSTGEEPYSMAMAVMEAVPDWKSRDIRILGSDINNHSLMRALEGGYRSWKLRVTKKKYLDKHFNRIGESYVVKDEVKALVDFIHLDLRAAHSQSSHLMPVSFDAIFCRNVMIYFSEDTIKQVVESFASALKPGGYLFLGYSETLSNISTKFERQLENGLIFYRKRDGQQTFADKPHPAVPPVAIAKKLHMADRTIPRQQPASIPLHPEESRNLNAPYEESVARKIEGSYVSAENLFERLVDRSPDQKDKILGKAMALAYSGRFNESLERCNSALLIDDLLPEAYFIRGFVYDLTDRKTEAIDEYRKSILLKMDFVMPHYQLGKLYSRSGQHKSGKRALKNSLNLLEMVECEAIIPYSGGVPREVFLVQLRDEISRIDNELLK